MSTPEQRGFDDQYDINASETIRQSSVQCDNNGQCANTVSDGFPYVAGATTPCGYSNCGIPPQSYDDQRAPLRTSEYGASEMQLAAERVMDGAVAQGYEYFEDPYYMQAYEDGNVIAGSIPERHLVLRDDFNNDSIEATMAKDVSITDVNAADKFIAAESVRAPLVPMHGVKDALLAQQGAQGKQNASGYKKPLIFLGVALGVGVLACGGIYAYKKIKAKRAQV